MYSRVTRRKSLIAPNNRLESDGVTELHKGTHNITGPEIISLRVNWDSILPLMMDEFGNKGRTGQQSSQKTPQDLSGHGDSLMVWAYVSYNGVGELIIADGTMKINDYIDILNGSFSIPPGIGMGMPWLHLYSNTTMYQWIQRIMSGPGELNMMSRWTSGQFNHLTSK